MKELPQYQVDVLTEINNGNTDFENIVKTTGHPPLKVHRAMDALKDIGFIRMVPKTKKRNSAVMFLMVCAACIWLFRWPFVLIVVTSMIVKVL